MTAKQRAVKTLMLSPFYFKCFTVNERLHMVNDWAKLWENAE